MPTDRAHDAVCVVGHHSFTSSRYELSGGTRCLGHALTHAPTLRRSAKIALLVGTVLFAINQLDVVIRGNVDGLVLAKIALTYCVPFAVATYAVLASARNPNA
jgi:hypothetical protein